MRQLHPDALRMAEHDAPRTLPTNPGSPLYAVAEAGLYAMVIRAEVEGFTYPIEVAREVVLRLVDGRLTVQYPVWPP